MTTEAKAKKAGAKELVTNLNMDSLIDQVKANFKGNKSQKVTNKARQRGKQFVRTTKVNGQHSYQLYQHNPDVKLVVIEHLHRDREGKVFY